MSLCVAWKFTNEHGTKIGFASDSCVTVQSKDGPLEMPYGGVKVLSLPVRIVPPGNNIPGHQVPSFERVFGMAFVDGFLPAFLLKECLAELLKHLQVVGNPDQVTFDQICELVLKYHKHTQGQLRDYLKTGYEVSFFFGGICPSTKQLRVAKFETDFNTEEPAYHEILQGDGVRFETLGLSRAQDRFRELFELNLSAPPCRVDFAVWRRFREVLRDPTIPFVDGAVQHGEFDDSGNFKFSGTVDMNFVDGRPEARMYMCGVDIYEVHQAEGIGDLDFTYSYSNPLSEDAKAFDPSRFWNDDGTGPVIDETITVIPHEDSWHNEFVSECDFLQKMLGADCLGLEHIGSTVLPGIPSRPAIDILLGVRSLGDRPRPPFNLSLFDYEFLGEVGIQSRLLYRKRKNGLFDLHVVEEGGEFWTKALRLRQYLRDHPAEARAFALEKLRILNCGAWTAKRYLGLRAPFLHEMIAKAIT